MELIAPDLPSRPVQIRLGDFVDDAGKAALRCNCGEPYSLVASSADELHMLGRKIPPGALVAYDPDEVERWFLTPAACTRALEPARKRLARDPTAALSLGYHLQEAALDWGANEPSPR